MVPMLGRRNPGAPVPFTTVSRAGNIHAVFNDALESTMTHVSDS